MEENYKQQISDSTILKIAIVGPECTGKTTLTKALALQYGTEWVAEFARSYLQEKLNKEKKICEPSDMLPILAGQIKDENEAISRASVFLFSDTCALQSKVYSDLYFGQTDPMLERAARKHKYDLFFLTQVDLPWEQDDLRDRPHDRENYFSVFKQALEQLNKPFFVLSGNKEKRLQDAKTILDDLLFAKTMGLTSQDFLQVRKKGVNLRDIEQHLGYLKRGIPKADLHRSATIGDGILQLTEAECNQKASAFNQVSKGLVLEKFVPASGAASRMFKFLSEFQNQFDASNETINAYINRCQAAELRVFLAGLEKFSFYKTVSRDLEKLFPDFDSWDASRKATQIIEYLLSPEQFNFSNLPKGVLPFHKNQGRLVTPVEEHLLEAVSYARSNTTARLHFTISEKHQLLFEQVINEVKSVIEKDHDCIIDCSFSYQNPGTDTIAVSDALSLFRDHENKLVFRPGGHGALIHNLGQRDADIIFIKNIDNVSQNQKEQISIYKKALGHVLIEIRNEVFRCLRKIEQGSVSETDLNEMISFARCKLNIETIDDFEKFTLPNKIDYLKEMLNRPIRVCGMVKNEGEPGGGPFWVTDKKGVPRLQIVESSQIDFTNPLQAEIAKQATHFNPVDLVCSIKNYLGEKFNLTDFTDPKSGFIVKKNKYGQQLIAYELPGLWNGAMAKWITIFIEVPLITFNPVKTVNDLLKSAHQENG